MFGKNTIVNRKKKKMLFKRNSFLIPAIAITLILSLVYTNIAVSSKTYKLISCNKELDQLNSEKKDLDEEIKALTSPVTVREKAINKLEMIDIENIDELIEIQP